MERTRQLGQIPGCMSTHVRSAYTLADLLRAPSAIYDVTVYHRLRSVVRHERLVMFLAEVFGQLARRGIGPRRPAPGEEQLLFPVNLTVVKQAGDRVHEVLPGYARESFQGIPVCSVWVAAQVLQYLLDGPQWLEAVSLTRLRASLPRLRRYCGHRDGSRLVGPED